MLRLTPSAAALASDDGTALALARSRLTLPAAVRGLRLAGWDRDWRRADVEQDQIMP